MKQRTACVRNAFSHKITWHLLQLFCLDRFLFNVSILVYCDLHDETPSWTMVMKRRLHDHHHQAMDTNKSPSVLAPLGSLHDEL